MVLFFSETLPELDIRSRLDEERKKQVLEKRQRLVPILKTNILHSHQNIPLRGHRDDRLKNMEAGATLYVCDCILNSRI